MTVSSFSFAPTDESVLSLQDIGGILAHRFTAVSSGRRKPHSVTFKLTRGGSTLSTWTRTANEGVDKVPEAPYWDLAGDVIHTTHTGTEGALEFSGATVGTKAEFVTPKVIPDGSALFITLAVDETLVGGDAEFEVNLYNDLDVKIGGSAVSRDVGDGTATLYLKIHVTEALTNPTLRIENGTWGASSGSMFVEDIVVQHYEPDTLQTTNITAYLYDIAEDEVIAASTTNLDISTLNLGVNTVEFLLDDPRFRIISGDEYYILFVLSSEDYTGWDTLLTSAEQAIPTGLLQRNLFSGMGEVSGITTETNTDFPAEVNSSPLRSTKTIATLSGTDTEVFSLNGSYVGLKPSTDYQMRLQVKPTALSGLLAGGGANIIDLNVEVTNSSGVLATVNYDVALEDVDVIYTPVLSFTTPSDDVGVRVEVEWDATLINPTYTPTITYKVSGIYIWDDDVPVTDPAKYQLPEQLVDYAGVFLVTEETPSETMSVRTAGAWVVDPSIGGVAVDVAANDATTTQVLLNAVGDVFFNLEDIWVADRLAQPAIMKSVLGYIEQGLALTGLKVPLPVQLRQNDTPYQSDWLVGLINDYGVNTLQENGVYIWTNEANEYVGRFFLKDGVMTPFSVPLGSGRVVLEEFSNGGGSIQSGTTTLYGLASKSFTLLRPAKVKFIWAVTARDNLTLSDHLANMKISLNGVQVPDGAGSDDVTDKFLAHGAGLSQASNMYFIEWTFDDILPAGAHSIGIGGTRGNVSVPQLSFKERIYTLPSDNNNYQLKDTSLLEIVYL